MVPEFVDRDSQVLPDQLFDRTARRAHQWAMVVLVLAGLVLSGVGGAGLLAVAGAIMLVGRLWWPADLVRQIVWRVLEPAGILRRDDVHEDHDTRRIARVLGGTIWLLAAVAMLTGSWLLGWVLALPIAAMVALDAALDFCALCFVVARVDRVRVVHRA